MLPVQLTPTRRTGNNRYQVDTPSAEKLHSSGEHIHTYLYTDGVVTLLTLLELDFMFCIEFSMEK